MKIPFVGGAYMMRSPAAGAAQTINLMTQFMEDPMNPGKNHAILVGTPGYHVMGNFDSLIVPAGSSDRITGVWATGGTRPGGSQPGRLFVVADHLGGGSLMAEFERGTYSHGPVFSSGSIAYVSGSKFALPGSVADQKPAQLFGNGNQLMIVKNGYTYIDNGTGPIQQRFLISGTVNTTSTGTGTSNCVWVSGDQFPAAMNAAGTYITINGVNYLITTYTDSTHLVLTEDAGNQTGASYRAPYGDFVTAVTGGYLDGYFIVQRPIGQYTIAGTATSATRDLTWVAGDFFDQITVGQTITFNASQFVVDTIVSPTHITLTTSAGVATASYTALVGADTGRQFNISHVDDGLSWDPLDFALKEANSDYLQSILTDHEQLYLLGTQTVEVWQNTGSSLFPFQRVPGAMIRKGSVARYAPAAINEKIHFVDGSPNGGPVAYRLDGFTPVRISTHAVEQFWAGNGSGGFFNASQLTGWAETHDGHQMWVLNLLDGSGLAWVYDATASDQAGTPIWHQRASYGSGVFGVYLPTCHTFVPEWGPGAGGESGMHVVGNNLGANLFEQAMDIIDDNGNDRGVQRVCPNIYAGGKQQVFGRMTLEMETGSAFSGGQPPITRDYSDDRGNSFVNPISPLTGGAGVPGAFAQRVFWPGSSTSRDRMYRFTLTGQQRFALFDLDVEYEVTDF